MLRRPRQKSRRRTGYIEVVAIIFVMILLVVAAVLLAVRHLDVNPLATPTPYATPTPSASAQPTPSPSATPGQYDPGQAFTQVQAFYTAYGQNSSVLSKYLTPTLAAQLNGPNSAPAIYCTYNVPSAISYDPPTAANNSATVVAHESFVDSPDIAVSVSVSLSTLLITAISCPQ